MTNNRQAMGVTTRRQLPRTTLLRKVGLSVATSMLALGLFVGAGGASAAPLDAAITPPAPIVQAATTSAPYYYSPTVEVPRYVASGDAVAVNAYYFDSYDAVDLGVVDGYGNVVSSGSTYTDGYGSFSGYLNMPYLEPGTYTLVAVDSYGITVTVGFWITYPY